MGRVAAGPDVSRRIGICCLILWFAASPAPALHGSQLRFRRPIWLAFVLSHALERFPAPAKMAGFRAFFVDPAAIARAGELGMAWNDERVEILQKLWLV